MTSEIHLTPTATKPAQHSQETAMTSELRNAVALWSDPSPPNDFCHYDHCSAKVPFGTMRIEWKSWKDYPNYCLYFDAGETFIGSFDSLDRAKEHAAAVIEADREAVRAEMRQALIATGDAAATHLKELTKFKALAETLAGALPDDIDLFRIIRAAGRSNAAKAQAVHAHLSEALRQYKESRDVAD